MVRAPSPPLLPGLNLSHRCRSAGEAGALLLLPEVTVFQPSSLLMGVFISQPNKHRLCLPLLRCSSGFTFFYLLSDVTQNMQSTFFPSPQMLHSRLTSSSRSLTWWYKSSASAHLLKAGDHSPAPAKGPRHFLQSCVLSVSGLRLLIYQQWLQPVLGTMPQRPSPPLHKYSGF